jgi:hypothetical protein
MLKYVNKILSLKRFLNTNVLIDNNTKEYISFNKEKWQKINTSKKSKKNKQIVLIDLFPWFPWIHFWGYIVNFLIKKFNVEVKFFYFDLYQGTGSNYNFYIRKLKKIYSSLNIKKGITEYDIKQDNIKSLYQKIIFKKIFISKKKLISYRKKNILIGDLIYDTYLRSTLKPTVDLKDPFLEKIFMRAENIFDYVNKYFKENKVFCIIPSHVCYISYGIISRIAASKKIPVYKIRSENRGNALYRLTKLSNKYMVDEPPYWNYKKKFEKFSKKQKYVNLKIGKKILEKRLSGEYDKNLPYMTTSQFKIKNKIAHKKNHKEVIVIFPHCYFDNPHRYRSMIFNDFHDQVLYFLKLSKKLNNYEWYYKPHPNELMGDLDVHKKLMKNFKNINYLNKSTSHYEILKLKPKCIVTNHGTIGHEYAAMKIPVINTGDNPHINYDFCIHAKNIKHLDMIMNNLDKYIKKINFDKKQIFEYLFMHYDYFQNFNNERSYLKDKYFSFRKIRLNNNSSLLNYFVKNGDRFDNKINKYLEEFFKKN